MGSGRAGSSEVSASKRPLRPVAAPSQRQHRQAEELPRHRSGPLVHVNPRIPDAPPRPQGASGRNLVREHTRLRLVVEQHNARIAATRRLYRSARPVLRRFRCSLLPQATSRAVVPGRIRAPGHSAHALAACATHRARLGHSRCQSGLLVALSLLAVRRNCGARHLVCPRKRSPEPALAYKTTGARSSSILSRCFGCVTQRQHRADRAHLHVRGRSGSTSVPQILRSRPAQ